MTNYCKATIFYICLLFSFAGIAQNQAEDNAVMEVESVQEDEEYLPTEGEQAAEDDTGDSASEDAASVESIPQPEPQPEPINLPTCGMVQKEGLVIAEWGACQIP